MGGRGRGRGRSALSFNVESLGIMHGEALPGPCLQPPPAYPVLEHHPAPLVLTPSTVIQLAYKVDLLNHLSKEVKSLNYPWYFFPYELRPGVKKRKGSTEVSSDGSKKSATITTNIEQLLAQLEKNETTQVKVEVEEAEEEKEKPEEEEEEFIDTDEEMDDGTDYNQNYFDNGEGYLDEDDDMDDGPIY